VRDGVSTNSIESVWAVLKRGVYGTFHHVSPKHLGRYIDELTFRIATLSLKGAQEIADGKKTEPI